MVADLGSGMNYHKKVLQRLLHAILNDQVGRLVLTHKDRALAPNWCSPSARPGKWK